MRNLGVFTWIHNVFVNLVSEAKRVELLTKAGDEFHFVARENFAGGIVGIADDDRSGLWIECRAKFVAIETPIRRAQRNVARLGIGKDCVRRIVLIERFEDNHFIAGIY